MPADAKRYLMQVAFQMSVPLFIGALILSAVAAAILGFKLL